MDVWDALPDDIRDELEREAAVAPGGSATASEAPEDCHTASGHQREHDRSPAPSGTDPTVWAALPPDIRADVLRAHKHENDRRSSALSLHGDARLATSSLSAVAISTASDLGGNTDIDKDVFLVNDGDDDENVSTFHQGRRREAASHIHSNHLSVNVDDDGDDDDDGDVVFDAAASSEASRSGYARRFGSHNETLGAFAVTSLPPVTDRMCPALSDMVRSVMYTSGAGREEWAWSLPEHEAVEAEAPTSDGSTRGEEASTSNPYALYTDVDFTADVSSIDGVRRDEADEAAAASASAPKCRCTPPRTARLRTVGKDGRNQGRRFWGCSAPGEMSARCEFFRWATPDEIPRHRFDSSLRWQVSAAEHGLDDHHCFART